MNKLLNQLNSDYLELHQKYETLFWDFYMGDHSLESDMNHAKLMLEDFKSSRSLYDEVCSELALCDDSEIKYRLEKWRQFFDLHQIPDGLKPLKQKISELEVSIEAQRSSRSEGYVDPGTGERVEMSVSQMRSRMVIEQDESMRKVLYEASNNIIKSDAIFLEQLVPLRNQFAQELGYRHYYDYMARTRDQLDCEYVWNIFDELFEKTYQNVRTFIEQKKIDNPILNRPWNRSHFLSGSFVKEEDAYYPLSEQLLRWGQTMTGWGADFQGATLKFDFLERKGKLNNGFCHQPIPLHTDQNGVVNPAVIGFTTTAIPGDIGEGSEMGMTLFHEGGHALHFATMNQPDVILNTEYPPSTTAWAEVQSMILDSIYSSFEWSSKYGKSIQGEYYPRDLYQRRISQLKPMSPMMQYQINLVTQFERRLYQQDELTSEQIIQKAGELGQKYLLFDEPQYFCLAPMHIYSSENACMYHSYGLADMAVEQIKSYVIEKDGFLVDNKNLIALLKPYQQLGSSGELLGYMKQMLGHEFSPDSLVTVFNRTVDEQLEHTKSILQSSQKHQAYYGPVDINAICEIRHGKEKIADNSISFESMCDTFRQFLTDYDRT